jgi:hypothetical protein
VNKQKILHTVAIILIAFFMLPTMSFPEEKKYSNNSLEFTLSAGAVSDGDIAFGENSELFVENSYMGSAKLAFYLDRLSAIEASFIARFDEAFYVPDKSIEDIDPTEYPRQDFFNYHFNIGLLYNFGDLVHVPFITTGVGITTLKFSREFDVPSAQTQFTIFGGLGYKYFIAESLALRVEFTFEYFDYESINNQNEFFLNVLLSAGLVTGYLRMK